MNKQTAIIYALCAVIVVLTIGNIVQFADIDDINNIRWDGTNKPQQVTFEGKVTYLYFPNDCTITINAGQTFTVTGASARACGVQGLQLGDKCKFVCETTDTHDIYKLIALQKLD